MHFPLIAQVSVVAVAALGVFGFVATAKEGETRRACASLCALQPNYAGRNRLAPDFELPQVGGGKLRLSSLRGKTVILNFWSKSCPPCLEEMPSFANLAKILREREGIVLVTITTDDSIEDARDTLRSVLGNDAPFTTLVDPDAKVVTELYGTRLYPETWIIDPQGVIRARFDGARDWASALVVEFAESLTRPYTCDVDFQAAKPVGDSAFVCSDLSRN